VEKWADIPGFVGKYRVSSDGRVLSLVQGSPRVLKPGRATQSGHLSVCLTRGNKKYVHRLVMLAFVGEPSPKQEVLHKNGCPTDNRLVNLRYGTRSENNLDISRHGRRKLTISQVKSIKRKTSVSAAEFSRKFKVSYSTIYAARSGQNWGYVD
jgi:DNA-binding transcriptional regulator YiaG